MSALGSEDAASANLANNLVFVSLSHPGEITACATTIRSHAARTAHARRQKSVKRHHPRPESDSSDDKKPHSMTLVKQRGPIPQQYFQSILWPKEFDPFDSFLRSLAPNEHKLIRVFVQHRVLKAMSYLPDPKMSYISDLDRFWHCVTMYWVQTALWDSGMLDSLFLLTCRYIADRAPGWKSGFTHQALHYKRRCLREIEYSESFTDHVITTRMAMVADETMFGTSTRVERHLREVCDLLRTRAAKERKEVVAFNRRSGNVLISYTQGCGGSSLGSVGWKLPDAAPGDEGEIGLVFYLGNGDASAVNFFAK